MRLLRTGWGNSSSLPTAARRIRLAAPGDRVRLSFDPAALHLFPAESCAIITARRREQKNDQASHHSDHRRRTDVRIHAPETRLGYRAAISSPSPASALPPPLPAAEPAPSCATRTPRISAPRCRSRPGPTITTRRSFEAFTEKTGVAVEVNVFGSNEEMLAKLQAGGTGWDLFVPTNYTISTYAKLGLIDPLDLSKLPNYSAESEAAASATKAPSTARPMRCRRTGAPPA